MASTTSSFAPILTPAQVGGLVIQPLISQSIAGIALTAVNISTHSYRVPLLTADPSASWTAEGAEIAATDATLDELDVTPSKLAALSVISRELANDSTPAAAEVVGQGIVRDLSRKVDQALFTASTTNGPAGLPGLSGVTSVSGPATAYNSADPFSDAIYTSARSTVTSTAEWKRLRLKVLRRDRYQCQAKLPGVCVGHADCVHHLVNTAAGGAPYDPDNCAASCTPCNASHATREAAAGRALRRAQVQREPLHPGLTR